MNHKLPLLSQAYLKALRGHLKPSKSLNQRTARALGVRALKHGLETLDLARIHEEALIALVLPHHSTRVSDRIMRRAGAFFAEAITPIEETHRGAREANIHLKAVIETLTQLTYDLAASNKNLQSEIAGRKIVEKSLRTSELTTSQLLKKSRHMQEELRLLSHRLLSVQEDERKRISRDLHDVIAQTLTGINLRLTALKLQSTASDKDLHEKIAVTQRLVEQSVGIVHRFARDLRPAVLDDLGLVPALESYVKGFREQTAIRVTLASCAEVEQLDNFQSTALYRIVQEALTNVARHARASRVKVRIYSLAGAVGMEIQDNGRGFPVESVKVSRSSKRLGLLGMRERVEMVGGTFCVESAPGKATTIRVEIPLAGAQKKTPEKTRSTTPTCP